MHQADGNLPLDSSHCCVATRNTVTPSSDSSDMYTSTVQSGLPSANVALPSHPRLQTSYSILYLLPLPPHHRPLLVVVLLCPLPPLPLTLSGFFNGMLEVSELGALNYFIFFSPIPLTLFVSRNPILTHLPLPGFSTL